MASIITFSLEFTLLSLLLAFAAGDPDITDDFSIPPSLNPANITGNFFTFTGLRGILGSAAPKMTITKVTKKEFPALIGQSVSLSLLQFPPGSVNPPHFHPRSSEAIYVLNGTLEFGFVDPATNKVVVNNIGPGYVFVVEKGVVHYQYNANKMSAASAISGFGSENAGTGSLPETLFGTGVDDEVLSKSFQTDAATIDKIKAAFDTKV